MTPTVNPRMARINRFRLRGLDAIRIRVDQAGLYVRVNCEVHPQMLRGVRQPVGHQFLGVHTVLNTFWEGERSSSPDLKDQMKLQSSGVDFSVFTLLDTFGVVGVEITDDPRGSSGFHLHQLRGGRSEHVIEYDHLMIPKYLAPFARTSIAMAATIPHCHFL